LAGFEEEKQQLEKLMVIERLTCKLISCQWQYSLTLRTAIMHDTSFNWSTYRRHRQMRLKWLFVLWQRTIDCTQKVWKRKQNIILPPSALKHIYFEPLSNILKTRFERLKPVPSIYAADLIYLYLWGCMPNITSEWLVKWPNMCFNETKMSVVLL
jgi:hypothetical protein